MFKKPVWDDLSFVTWCIILLEVASEDEYTVVIKGWTWSATILKLAVEFKRYSIGTKRPKVCQENIPHTITPPPPAWTVETRQDGSMLSYSLRQILTLPSECCSRNRESSDQAMFIQSSIVRHPVWSSAAVTHLLQGSTCCAFRDGFLHTLVVQLVTSGYLSCCCLSIISNQSAQSPLTSDINKVFSSTQLPLTGYFLFFGPFSVNPKDGCAWKSQ